MKKSFFRQGDLDAFLGVLFDIFPKLLSGIAILSVIGDALFTKILPATTLGLLLSGIFFYLLGERLKVKTGDDSIVAMPGGITSGRFFVWLFTLLGIFEATGDVTLVIFTGMAFNMISSVLSLLISLMGERFVKLIPSPVLFGSLAGGSLAWLVMSPLSSIFQTPVMGFASLMVVIIIYLANIKTKISPVVIGVVAGIIVGFVMQDIKFGTIIESTKTIGFYLPGAIIDGNYFGNLMTGFLEALKYLPLIIGFTILESVANFQGVEQARSVGDNYDITITSVGINIISFISAIFGNPFNLGIMWGYPGWKQAKAGTAYQLLVGGTFIIIGVLGIGGVIGSLIPAAIVLPVLVFIGCISSHGAFVGEKQEFYGLMFFVAALPLMEVFFNNGAAPLFLTKGSMIISLVWGSMLYFAITRDWKKASYALGVGALCALLGIIHTETLFFTVVQDNGVFASIGFRVEWVYVMMYLAAAAAAYAMSFAKLRYEGE
ncbi:MAG: hypothetical protein ACRC6X_07425 [Culicoidibacterales bacterium]